MATEMKQQEAKSLRKLPLHEILRDYETLQVRTAIDEKVVEQYARNMKAGTDFPPVEVYEVESQLLLTDGFHRVAAAEAVAAEKGQALPKIQAEVIKGTIADALKAAALANTRHGKQMGREDYRRSFRMLAKAGAFDSMNSREIASAMNHTVSHVTVIEWAKKDFPGLIEAKPKKGQKLLKERAMDHLSAVEVAHRAASSGLYQTSRLLREGKVTHYRSLDEIAALAEDILEEAKRRGGDAERGRAI